MENYYNILGIQQSASQEEIKRAYREQIKFFHPDVFQGPPEVARIKTLQLNEAYEVLSNPQKRQIYDLKLEYEQQKCKQEEKCKDKHREGKGFSGANKGQNNDDGEKYTENVSPESEKKREKRTGAPYWTVAVLIVLCLSLFAALVNSWATTNQKINDAVLDAEEWEGKYLQMQAIKESIEDKYTESEERGRTLAEFVDKSLPELLFWEDYAVIVTEHGGKYHTYGCQYVEGKQFLIYNVDAAVLMGYEPCSVCDPPEAEDLEQ